VELAVAFGEDGLGAAFELVAGRDAADGAVEAHGVVVGREVGDDPSGVVEFRGAPGRMQSRFKVACQRSCLPLDCG
jgi:hypothetical protein